MVAPGKRLSEEWEALRTGSRASPVPSMPLALTRWTEAVERELRQTKLSHDSLLGRMCAYHMGWVDESGNPAAAGGKRIRSSLCCWAAEACGGGAPAAFPAACAIELIHNFTLIHDDIQDGDRARRGRATVWSIWGAAQGINAGDGLLALALRTLLGEPSDGAPEMPASPVASGDQVRRSVAAQILLDGLMEVIEGQCLDLQYEGQLDTQPAAYLRMVEAKTGALIGASLEAGAVMGGAGLAERRCLRRAGRLLGISFQLRDDWLGTWGEPTETGKSQENDLSQRKLTYPVLAAFAVASPEQRRQLHDLYESRGSKQEPGIRELLLALGGPELTAGDAARHAAASVAEIERSGLATVRVQEFVDVTKYVAERNR